MYRSRLPTGNRVVVDWWCGGSWGFFLRSSTNHTLFNSLSDLVALLSTLLTPFHLYIASVGMFQLWV